MPITKGSVFIVDDDASVRAGLGRLMRCARDSVTTFPSAQQLGSAPASGPACLILDVRMREISGLELKEKLNQQGRKMQVILITADDAGRLTAAAVKLGAAGFFHKPVDGRALLDTIEFALCGELQKGHWPR
jgi:FixJ family two-component response regulator